VDAYANQAKALRAPLGKCIDHRELVRYAALAANGHNAQAWKFCIHKRQIDVIVDRTRCTPVVDPDEHHLFVSLGCAVENLALAAQASGLHANTDSHPDCVSVQLEDAEPVRGVLFQAIPHRQSTRSAFDGTLVKSAECTILRKTCLPDVHVILLTERPKIEHVLELVLAGNAAQIADAAFVRELKTWLRFNPRAAMRTGDGLFTGTSGNKAVPTWLADLVFERFFTVRQENERAVKQVRSSSGIAIFVGAREDRTSWIDVGRSCQRFALQATALGIRTSFINQPVEVASLRSALAAVAGVPGFRPDIVMRFGYGAAMPYSLRRPTASIVEHDVGGNV
jgi:nitroreductase